MSIKLQPPIKQFIPSPALQMLPNIWRTAPPEGSLQIPIEIDWDGVTCTWDINLNLLGAGQLSAIRSVWINNENCGSRLKLIAKDTGQVVTVPAFSCGLYPIFSPSRELYLSCPLDLGVGGTNTPYANSVDQTFLVFYNDVLPPIPAVPSAPPLNTIARQTGLTASFNSTLSSVTGSLFWAEFSVSNLTGGASPGSMALQLIDGDGNPIYENSIAWGTSSPLANYTIGRINPSNLNIRYFLNLHLIGTLSGTAPTGGTLSHNYLLSNL